MKYIQLDGVRPRLLKNIQNVLINLFSIIHLIDCYNEYLIIVNKYLNLLIVSLFDVVDIKYGPRSDNFKKMLRFDHSKKIKFINCLSLITTSKTLDI